MARTQAGLSVQEKSEIREILQEMEPTRPRAGKPRREPERQRSLWEDGALVDLDIGYWTGRKALRPEDLEPLGVDPNDVPDIYSLGRKLLVPAETIRAFRNIESRARYALLVNSVAFPIANVRFVPLRRLDETEAQLQRLRDEFFQEARLLLDRYGQLREEMLSRYRRFAKALADYYPSSAELQGKFHFSWSVFALSVPKLKRADPKALIRYAEAQEQATQLYRRQLEAKLNEFVESAAKELRARVAEVARTVSATLKKNGAITERSLQSLRKVVEDFRALNFIGDHITETELQRLERQYLTRRAAEFGQDDVRALGAALDLIVRNAQNASDISSVTGAYRRKVRLD